MRPISIEGLTDDDILSLIYYMGGWENDVLNFFNSSELERLLRLRNQGLLTHDFILPALLINMYVIYSDTAHARLFEDMKCMKIKKEN